MKSVKKVAIVLLVLNLILTITPAFGDVISATPYASTNPFCNDLSGVLRIGKYDNTTNGGVTILQNFLHDKGYLSVSATGYFGPLTFRAVKAFQSVSASGAVDGIVGVQTWAHIRAIGCASTPASNASTISVITPAAGPSGSTVTITGSNFTPTGNIVHFAIGGISNLSSVVIPSTSSGPALQQISFVVPSSIGPYCKPDQACALYLALLNAGTYPVYVENANGISNTISFTITNNATMIPQ